MALWGGRVVPRAEIDAYDFRTMAVFFDALFRTYDLKRAEALDMFARDGSLTVMHYAHRVSDVDLWEINPEHEKALRVFSPRDLVIGCAHQELRNTTRKYDMIVVDGPQGLYSAYDGVHSEHFDVLPLLPRVMKDRCVVVLYVNLRPYDASKLGSHGKDTYPEFDFQEWMRRRSEFYGTAEPQFLTLAKAMGAYEWWAGEAGLEIRSHLVVPCYELGIGMPRSFRIALEMVRS